MKILCFMPNYIGDVLMVTPAIRLLKEKIENCEIFTIIKPNLVELLEDNPNVNNYILKTSKKEIFKKLLKMKMDYIILFRTTFFNSFISFFLNPKFSVGINEDFSSLFLKKALRKDITRPYRAECVMLANEILKYLRISTDISTDIFKKLDFYGWEKEEIKKSLDEKLFLLNVKGKIITVICCSSRKTKMLFLRQYVELIEQLKDNYPEYTLILVGSKDDEYFINQIINSTNYGVKSLCGKTTLKELACLFKMSSLVIAPDSGPAYISEAVGAKTFIYFTSTIPEKYGPFPTNVKFLYKPTLCSPCYKNYCYRKDYKCIKQIEIKEILNSIDDLL